MIDWISVKDRLPTENGKYLCHFGLQLKPGEVRIGDSPFVEKYQLVNYYAQATVLGHAHKVPFWDVVGWNFNDISHYITHWAIINEPIWYH